MSHNPDDPLQTLKAVCSVGLVIFSIVIVSALQFTEQTKVAEAVHPALAFCLMWLCLLWLSMVEGSQASLVGLPPVNKELYKESHPTTYKIACKAFDGDNLDRYLLGRQFMVVFIVFSINQCGGPLPDSDVLGLPDWLQTIFLGFGIAMILLAANIGQLLAQVIASHSMLDYINNSFATFTIGVAYMIEFSGCMHASYLIQYMVAAAAGQKIESNEAPPEGAAKMFFWGRILASVALLGYCFAVTLAALFQGKTTMWEGVPEVVSVILFFVFMSIVGTLEGMQIAFFAMAKLSKEEQSDHPMAMKVCDILFGGDGRNLPGFMVGRQICVTLCFFIIARVTSLNVDTDAGEETIFGVSNGIQQFFNTGLLGAVITTIVGSISWQLVASAFPVAFLSNPVVYVLLRFCLFLEATGICAASWVFGSFVQKTAGWQRDEVYIGTPEERAARAMADDDDAKSVQTGHLFPGTTIPTKAGVHDPESLELKDRVAMLEAQIRRLTGTEYSAEDLDIQTTASGESA